MRRALTPDEAEERPMCRCGVSLVRTIRGDDGRMHVWRQMPDGSEHEVCPSCEWTDESFESLTLPDAAGGRFEGLAEGLWRAGLRTVADLVDAWQVDDPRLRDGATQLPGLKDSRPMFATRHQIRLFLGHLQRRRAEWERSTGR